MATFYALVYLPDDPASVSAAGGAWLEAGRRLTERALRGIALGPRDRPVNQASALRGDVSLLINPATQESWQRGIERLRSGELDSLMFEWSTERRQEDGAASLGTIEFQDGTATLSRWAAASISLEWGLVRRWPHAVCRVVAMASRLVATTNGATGVVGLAMRAWPAPAEAWDLGMLAGWELQFRHLDWHRLCHSDQPGAADR